MFIMDEQGRSHAIGRIAHTVKESITASTAGWKQLGEILSETAFATHANWDVTGDVDDSGGNAAFTFASGSLNGTLTQTAANRAYTGDGYQRYRLTYTVAVTTAPDGDFALELKTFSGSTTSLAVTAGTHTVDFDAAEGAASADFVIEASETTATQGAFTIDNISVVPLEDTAIYRIISDVDVYLKQGSSAPTATTSDMYLPADHETFINSMGGNRYLGFISETDGNIWITRIT